MGLGAAFGAAANAYDAREEEKRIAEKKRILSQSPSNLYTGSDVANPYTAPEVASVGANKYSGQISDADLLSSIAKNEGTYDTGYDTEYAYGKYGSDRKPLAEMSINEVLDYQDGMVGNQSGDLKSSAIGRYQMLRQTIRDGMKEGNYNGTELFTDKVQDAMIMQRLGSRRGYNDWREGTISDDKFKSHLAREFASINDPYTGKGHYGQGSKPLMWD